MFAQIREEIPVKIDFNNLLHWIKVKIRDKKMIGKLATFIFNLKAKSIMKAAVKDPRFKSALEDYAKDTEKFRKKLKDYYGSSDIDAIPRITDLK